MRKILLAAALGITALAMSQDAQAQVRDCVIVGNILRSARTAWGPSSSTPVKPAICFLTATGLS